jgi:hypothetical protein
MGLNSRELQQLDAAVLAHSRWITDLNVAIEDASSAFDPETVKTDNHCKFGKWLYDDFPKSGRGSTVFEDIRRTHAAFHESAAQILRLAMDGHKDDALRLMEYEGDFMTLSGHLILLLKELRAS